MKAMSGSGHEDNFFSTKYSYFLLDLPDVF